MFRRKQDVDRHVSNILGKIKEEREKYAKGYQIARLYFEVREYDVARRYLANFLSVRETVPQAYRLLGEIEEAVGNKENAVGAYKRFLDLGGQRKDVVLKICELYADIGVNPEKGKYWLKEAEQLYPQSDVVFKLKEKLLTARPGQSTDEDMENLITSELLKKPHDVELRIKLLQVYLKSNRLEEAYTNAVETDRKAAFTSCLDWYECLYDVFRAYQSERDTRQDPVFMFHYLVVLLNLTYLRLANKDVVESAAALHSFDLAVQLAVELTNSTEQWEAFVTEMQGQLFFLAGTLLLKRAQKGSVSWDDMCPLTAVLYALCQTIPTIDAQATWFVRPTQDREKLYAWLYKNSFFRISQSGHSLYQLSEGDNTSAWLHQVQQQFCTLVGQERMYEALFPIRDMRIHSGESYLLNTHKYCNTSLNMPARRQLIDVDRVAHTFHPDNLSELVWLCLQQYSFGDPYQPDYDFRLFEKLQYGVKNIENGAAETLCQLDTEAFLYATVRCSALQLKEQQLSVEIDVSRPPMLPLCLCKKLCSPDQQQWWHAAHSFYSNSIKESFSKMRHILQRGIEVVRLIGSHGLSAAMVVHLAKTFDAKRRPCRARMRHEDLVKSLTEGNQGRRGSINQLACLEARASMYWRQALAMLTRFERNMRGPAIKVRLFDDGDDADLTPHAMQELLHDAKFASATIAMREGHYEEALKGFEKLTTPYASFYRAQIYKTLAQQELEGNGPQGVKQEKYTVLIAQAREALYRTMDHLGGNKNHELSILLTRELDDVESKLNCIDWDSANSNRDNFDENSALPTPVKQSGRNDDFSHPHSTPKSAGPSKSVRQRLLLSELTNDSTISTQQAPLSSPLAHARPSPERLDAQIKSINYSQSQLFKVVLDRNEELVVMYRGLVDELRESNAHLKAALGENRILMEELKKVLVNNKDSKASLQSELAETKDIVRQLKDEFQANTAATAASNSTLLNAQGLAASQITAAGYFMGPPFHPSQYPPYAQAPHMAAPGAGYRYPLLPGYPLPRPTTPVAPAATVRLSERPGGTAPSSFGKFRGGDHQSVTDVITTEDEDEDEENGLSLCGSEYGESLLQTPGAQYFMSTDHALVPDWLPTAHHTAPAAPTVTFPTASQPHGQATIPQPGFFASALRGQALHYAPTTTTAAHSLTMPGPGFFSAPVISTSSTGVVSVGVTSQSAIVTALGGKTGLTAAQSSSQPVPVLGTGLAKGSHPVFTSVQGGEPLGMATLFQDHARMATTGVEMSPVDVKVVQDARSKEGNIIVRKKNTQEIVINHTISAIKVGSSFQKNQFLWAVNNAEKKLDETFTLNFQSAEQTKTLKSAVEQVMKNAGIKQSASPVPAFASKLSGPSFAAMSPARSSHLTPAISAQDATRTTRNGAVATTSGQLVSGAKTTTTSTQALETKTTFGGFTFNATPIIKARESSQDSTKSGSQLKLKESSLKVTSPTSTSSVTPGSSDLTKPFAGFKFTPPKPAATALESPNTPTTPVAAVSGAGSSGQTFVFGSGLPSGTATFAGLSQQHSSDAFKPKEGFTGFQVSPQPMFSQSSPTAKSLGGKEEEGNEEYEPNVDFKPIIDLPDLVDVKTGEEDEQKVFSDRVKLYRFDSELNQWKERGIGELKILRALGPTARFRIIMRREQVLKVCANHFISTDMKLTPLSASDRAWCYTASDFTEEEMKVEKFAVKFKTPEKAGDFKSIFENCQKEIINEGQESASAATPVEKPAEQMLEVKSLAEMFKPPEDSWDCPLCCINNKASVKHCVACETGRPGAEAETGKTSSQEEAAGAVCTGDFVSPSSEKSIAEDSSGRKSIKSVKPAGGQVEEKMPLADMFKTPEGSWECPGCCIQNAANVIRCPACQTVRPGTKAEDVKSASSKEDPFAPASSAGSFGGRFKFGGATDKKSLAEMFKPPEGSWECPNCCIQNAADVIQCLACQTSRPGTKPEDVKSTSPKEDPFAPVSSTGSFGGFKFGSAAEKKGTPTAGVDFQFGSTEDSSETGGFKFVAPQKTVSSASSSTPTGFKFTFGTSSTKASTPTPSAGFVFGPSKPAPFPPQISTPSAFNFGSSSAKDSVSKDSGFSFGKPQSSPPSTEQKPQSGSALLQQLLTSEDTPEKPNQTASVRPFGSISPAVSDAADNSQLGLGFQGRLGQITSPTTDKDPDRKESSGFQFTFSLQKQNQQQPTSPRSPEVDASGFYLNKDGDDCHIFFEPVVPLPEKVEVKTGEEDEEVLLESRAKLFRFTAGEWKERGIGVLKILKHRSSGRIRLLMRRDQVLKICCNHYITSELDLKPMSRSDGKAWIWYAMDFTEGVGNMEQLAVRFRDADTANNFKRVFDESREIMKTPSKADAAESDPSAASAGSAPKTSTSVSRELFERNEDKDESDVELLYEEKPTEDQLLRARKLLLPDTFYLYENRPGCPGCIGCEDYDLSKSPVALASKEPEKSVTRAIAAHREVPHRPVQEGLFQQGFETNGFGGEGYLSFSALAATNSGTSSFGSKDPSKPFLWAGAGQKLFRAGHDEEAEEGEVAPADDIHFEPVISLPELVETKTGEEDWTALFTERAKVYRFDGNQWKERGIGDMKIMKHKTKLLFRVLQRREQVLKVACNHLISTDMELKPLATSESAWCWVATDYTEGEPKVEQLAVKFKKVELAKEFKAIFEDCQEKLRQGESTELVQEIMVSSSQQLSGDHSQGLSSGDHDMVSSSSQPVTGDRGNPYYTQQLDAKAEDIMVSTSQPVTGDKGNPYFSAALDRAVIEQSDEMVGQSPEQDEAAEAVQETIVSSSQQSSGDHSQDLSIPVQDTMTSVIQPVTGDRGNPYYSQQLDATETDTMVSTTQPVTGDRGNPYFSQALNVATQDAQITSTQFQPLEEDRNPHFSQLLASDNGQDAASLDLDDTDGQTRLPVGTGKSVNHTQLSNITSQYFSTEQSASVNGENVQHTKPAAVLSQDSTTQPGVIILGEKGIVSQNQQLDEAAKYIISQQAMTPLGARGNVYYTQQLDVESRDAMTQQAVTQLGDRGNVYHTQQLNVTSRDAMTQQAVTSLGDRGNVYHIQQLDVASKDTMTQEAITPLGDRGNVYHTQQLDVASRDAMTQQAVPQLGDRGDVYHTQQLDVESRDAMTQQAVTQLGDRGNVYHTQQLNVTSRDAMTQQAVTSLGDSVTSRDAMTQQAVTSLGDRGNVYHTQQLDVASKDTMTQQAITPLGDRGNVYHTQQLDVESRDAMTQQAVTQLGDRGNVYHTQQLNVTSRDAKTQQAITPLGDRGNVYYTQQLDVASRDAVTQQAVPQLGDRGNGCYTQQLDVESRDAMTQQAVTSLGDRGNVYHTQQLDVASKDTMIQQAITPLGDRGNVYHTQQLDVASRDAMTQQAITPLGDRGNVYHTQQLDVASRDAMTQQAVPQLGDRGNVYHTQQLDVESRDAMTQQAVTQLGDSGNVYHTQQLDVATKDTMIQQAITPLGDRGNMYHTQQLDVTSRDAMTQQAITPLGDRGNVYHSQQLDVASKDAMTPQAITPLGDRGNVYYTQQLDVASRDAMTQQAITPLGDRGNVYYTQQLDVASRDAMTQQAVTQLGDRGNVYHTRQLDVASRDAMTQQAVTSLGDRGNVYHTQQLDAASKSAIIQGNGENICSPWSDMASQNTMAQDIFALRREQINDYNTQHSNMTSQGIEQQALSNFCEQGNVSPGQAFVASSQAVPGLQGGSQVTCSGLTIHTLEIDLSSQKSLPSQIKQLGTEGCLLNCEDQRKGRQSNKRRGLAIFPYRMEALGTDAEDLSEDYDEDDSTDEEDEDEQVEFEKRVTLFCREGSEWKKLDLGTLRVLYDDDLNANKLIVISDKGDKLCNHVICMEHTIDMDEKEKSCEWEVNDFATDEPVPRHFKAHFSSRQAAEEFATIFRQGQKLAAESEISSKIPEEIEVPEVFSTEDRPQGAAAPEI